MKHECIVSTLVVLEVETGDIAHTGIIEALAKHEFLSNLGKITADDLTVEILESEA